MTTPSDDAPDTDTTDTDTTDIDTPDIDTTTIVVVSTAAPARSSATSRHAPTRRTLPRRVGALAAFALLTGGVLVGTAVVVERLRDDGETTTADPSALFKTSTVSSGSLTTTERIDASVSLSETTAILHRIDGQSSSSVVGSGTSSPSGSSSAFPSGLMGTAAAESVTRDTIDPCVTSTTTSATSTTSTTTTLGGPPTGSVPGGSVPTGSVPGGSTPGGSSLQASFAEPGTTDETPGTTDGGSTTTDAATSSTADTSSTSTTTSTSSPTSTSPPTSSTSSTSTLPATTTTECDTSTSTTSTTSTLPGTTTTSPDSTTTTPGGAPTGGFPTGGGTGTSPGGGTTGGSSTGTSGSTARVTQTITSVIEVGSEVSLGVVLYTVEGTKVVAMAGVLPAWRTLEADVDPGQDVLQLELSLTALGYDPDGELVVDTEWDDATDAAVEAWQEGLGQEATGVVELGSIVFLSTLTDVVAVSAAAGDEVGDGDPILTVSSPAQSIVIDVPHGTESVIVPGLVVSIGDVEGTVSHLRSVERDGSVVVQAVITPSAELEGALDGSTTSVQVVIEGADGVLLVPVEAIASRLDGSYAVQVSTDGTSNPSTATWVDVEVLGQVGTQVGVRGDGLTIGAEVLLPV